MEIQTDCVYCVFSAVRHLHTHTTNAFHLHVLPSERLFEEMTVMEFDVL